MRRNAPLHEESHMKRLRIVTGLSLLTLGACAGVASPSGAPGPALAVGAASVPAELKRVIVSGERVRRTVDCKGADVNVAVNDGVVRLLQCDDIIISGSRDHVTAALLPPSAILVLGDHDVVRWTSAEGNSNRVQDRGKGNTTAPL